MKHVPLLDLPWSDIDSILLDMDGTLLDLNFDTYFWAEHIPQRYAEKNALTLAEAKAQLYPRFHACAGTMEWYCLDHWSRELDLPVAQLKREVEHLIAIHPRVEEFLGYLQAMDKRVWLVTNAHRHSLRLKMERTRLGAYFDAIICSHDYQIPKENADFWRRLRAQYAFLPQRTLLVDDSLPVLQSAHAYGIAHLCAIARPDSRQPLREVEEFPAILDFGGIMPSWRGESI